MRIARILLAGLIILSVSACSRWGKGSGDLDNIPDAEAGSILKDVTFDFDSSALSASAQSSLQTSAAYLGEHSSINVVVEGHCDERGTNEYNMALGERRARAVYDYMKTLGVDGSRMSTISYGEELPLDPGHSEAAWSKNRRAHFAIK